MQESRALATGRVALRVAPDRRRSVLVDKRHQLRAASLVGIVALLLLVPLNLNLYVARTQNSAELLGEAPDLAAMVIAQDRLEAALTFLSSSLFVVIVFLVAILQTHRTTGAALHLARCFEALAAGRCGVQAHLRRYDNLKNLERVFNQVSATLEDRAWRDVETLEGLAAAAEDVRDPEDARLLARRLRDLAEHRRGRLGGEAAAPTAAPPPAASLAR